MISKALPQEKKIVYGIWKQVFAGDDGGYTDYFFRTLYLSLIHIYPAQVFFQGSALL